jgi:hypothetical protein
MNETIADFVGTVVLCILSSALSGSEWCTSMAGDVDSGFSVLA